MQPCDELKNIVLHHYGKFDSNGQAETIHATYSLQEGVVIIGNDPEEWVENRKGLKAWMTEGSSVKAEITVQNIKAMCEGSVGWTMDRVTVKFPNGVEVPIRHTRIFHKEDGGWRMVHLHASIPVPNDEIGK
jgi:ketosteroid isomerase-like protein